MIVNSQTVAHQNSLEQVACNECFNVYNYGIGKLAADDFALLPGRKGDNMADSRKGEALISEVSEKYARLKSEIARVIVGQESVVSEMLISLLCKGHCLIVGVPGLAKTLLVRTLARLLDLKFGRIQFTPDLMPADITGTDILQEDPQTGRKCFEFARGPLFGNIILADEINRTPPKTQSALLEAMQEKTVTAYGKTMILEEPFIVFATQNPIEHEGTYPLPEAQLDRFFFNILIDYPSFEEERKVLEATTSASLPQLASIFSRDDILRMQQLVLAVPVPEHVFEYVLRIVHTLRPKSGLAIDCVKQYVEWGPGPRAGQTLILAAKAHALLNGEPAASCAGVKARLMPSLRHRVIPNYNATGEGVNVEAILAKVMAEVKEPEYGRH